LILLLWCVRPALAQVPADALLRGTVLDASGAVLVDAAIVVAAPQLIGGPRTVATDSDGRWRAPALAAGDYAVTVSAAGFTTVVYEGVRLLPGATLTLDTRLDVATLSEQTRVEASRPAVDVTTAAVNFTVSERFLQGLPTTRTFSDLLNLVPGVAGDQAFGGTKRSNGLMVDGVDTTEASEQEPWLRITQNWLQEVQVVGLGAEAEYGLTTGLTAFAVVRSGTNRFAGLSEAWGVPSSWVAVNTQSLSRTLQRQFASARIDAYWNTNGQLGGPLRRDGLWFFAGLDHTTKDGAPAGYSGPDSQQEVDSRAIGKLTWKAWPSGLIEGFLQGGRRHVVNWGLGVTTPSEAAADYRQPQISGDARALHTAGQALAVDVRVSAYRSPGITSPQAPGSVDGPSGHYDQLNDRYSANLLFYSRDDRWRRTIAAAVSWYGRLGALTHDLKGGLQVEQAHEQTTSGYSGGLAYFDLGNDPYEVVFNEGFGESSLRGDTARVTLYLQDRVGLGSRLTVLPGLRVDRFRRSTAAADDALTNAPISPRLGVAWDVFRDHRTVVRAHIGRFTDPAFSQPVLLTDTAQRPIQIRARVIAPGVFEEVQRQDFRTRFLADDLRSSYVDQFVGGVEHQLPAGISVLAQYVQREFRGFAGLIPDDVTWAPVERRDPGPDGVLNTQDDGALFTVYARTSAAPVRTVYQNIDSAWRRYRAGQLVLRTTGAAPWQFEASYTRSQTRGTASTGFHANSGARTFINANPNRLINGDGLLGFDPTTQLKALALWSPRRFGGWTVSGVYRYTTGGAWGRVFLATGLPQGSEAIRVEPRGTRRLPAINQLDLRVEKTLRIRGTMLGAYVDVFNVSNQGVPESEWPDVVNSVSGPNFGVPSLWRAPRQGRVGVRVSF
jgi:hypothetical protein